MLAKGRIAGALLALSTLLGSPAFAQQAYCARQGRMDPQATQTLQGMLARTDPQLMQALVGVWYSESAQPQLNTVTYSYNSYEPGGLFQYSQRICGGMANACSDYQGTGMFGAVQTGNGQFTLLMMVSDLNRDHECIGSSGRFVGEGQIQDNGGALWRKVR